MAERVTGASLFFGAIGDVLAHPGAVLRIVALPFAVLVAADAWATTRYVEWYNATSSLNPPGEWPVALVFYVVVGLVAVAWHRHMILNDTPQSVVPRLKLSRLAKYTLGWIVIGIIVGLAAVLLVIVPVFVVGSMIDPVFGQWLVELVVPSTSGSPDDPTTASYALGVFGLVALLFFYVYAVFRVSMGLPALAVDAPPQAGLRASWRWTRPLARPILGAACFAVLAQGIAFAVQIAVFSTPFAGVTSFAAEFPRRLVVAVIDVVNVLIGAAILTRIYRAASASEAVSDAD